MHWTQAALVALLCLSIYTGRQPTVVWLAMVVNLTGTMFLKADPMSVAAVDMVSIVMLLGEGRRARNVALLFVAMQPLYLAHYYLGLQKALVYGVVDLIALVQLGVLGGWDIGLGRAYRLTRGRLLRRDTAAISGGHASVNMAGHSGENRRG